MACDTTQNHRNPRVQIAFERMVQDFLKRKETQCHAPTERTDPQLNRGERRPGKVIPFMSERHRKSKLKLPTTEPRKARNFMHSNPLRPKHSTR